MHRIFVPFMYSESHDVLHNGTLADTGHTHNHEAAIGAVVPALPGVQNHQARRLLSFAK